MEAPEEAGMAGSRVRLQAGAAGSELDKELGWQRCEIRKRQRRGCRSCIRLGDKAAMCLARDWMESCMRPKGRVSVG